MADVVDFDIPARAFNFREAVTPFWLETKTTLRVADESDAAS